MKNIKTFDEELYLSMTAFCENYDWALSPSSISGCLSDMEIAFIFKDPSYKLTFHIYIHKSNLSIEATIGVWPEGRFEELDLYELEEAKIKTSTLCKENRDLSNAPEKFWRAFEMAFMDIRAFKHATYSIAKKNFFHNTSNKWFSTEFKPYINRHTLTENHIYCVKIDSKLRLCKLHSGQLLDKNKPNSGIKKPADGSHYKFYWKDIVNPDEKPFIPYKRASHWMRMVAP